MKRLFLQDRHYDMNIYDSSERGIILGADYQIHRSQGVRMILPTIPNLSWLDWEALALKMIMLACEKKEILVARWAFWSMARLHHEEPRFPNCKLAHALVSPYTHISVLETDRRYASVIMDHRVEKNVVYSFADPEDVGVINIEANTPKSFGIHSPNHIMKWRLDG
jgi:hypothetical protein